MKRYWLYCLLLSLLVNGSIHLTGGVEQAKNRIYKIVLNDHSLLDYYTSPSLKNNPSQTTFRSIDKERLTNNHLLKPPNMDNFIIGYAE